MTAAELVFASLTAGGLVLGWCFVVRLWLSI